MITAALMRGDMNEARRLAYECPDYGSENEVAEQFADILEKYKKEQADSYMGRGKFDDLFARLKAMQA